MRFSDLRILIYLIQKRIFIEKIAGEQSLVSEVIFVLVRRKLEFNNTGFL
jgi:hypothetical protein